MIWTFVEDIEKSLRPSPGPAHNEGWPPYLAPGKSVPWSIANHQHKDQTRVGLGLGYSILTRRKVVKWDPQGSQKPKTAQLKAAGVLPLITIQRGHHPTGGPHGNDMSCLLIPILMSACFEQGIQTSTPRDTQKRRTCSLSSQRAKSKNKREKSRGNTRSNCSREQSRSRHKAVSKELLFVWYR